MNINNYKTAMRKIVTLIMLCTSLVLRAQNDVLVIYIDASESGDKLIQIKDEVDGSGISDNKTMADYKKSILWLAASNYFEGVGI